MFVTIWMWTHEWSLISRRTVAFTFATCHHAFSCLSAFARSISVRSLRFARAGSLTRICATASAGLSRVSRSASAETGRSIRPSVVGSRPTAGTLGDLGPVPVQARVEPAAAHELVVRALLDDQAVLEYDD